MLHVHKHCIWWEAGVDLYVPLKRCKILMTAEAHVTKLFQLLAPVWNSLQLEIKMIQLKYYSQVFAQDPLVACFQFELNDDICLITLFTLLCFICINCNVV